jgi:hypothetical protein
VRSVEAERDVNAEVDPNESPFALPPGSGATIPFAKDSEEARAIQAVIEETERERSAASGRVEAERDVNAEVDPNESPFALPPGSGATIPFGKDSEEARAIEAAIEETERERAAAEASED